MDFIYPFWDWRFEELLESLLPDFILAFALFTSICYAVLSRRFEQQRPAIAVSVVIGFALSIGLVWWEYQNGYSIKDLGPIAVGFAILLLAIVMYQAIRHIGGSWAGAGITIGLCLIIAWILGADWPVRDEILQIVITVAILMGLIAFFSHHHGHIYSSRNVSRPAAIRHDMGNLRDDRHVSKKLHRGFHRLRKETDHLNEHPRQAQDVMLQLRRMLPAEGRLTERLAQLREKAYRARKGHVAKIEEIQHAFSKMNTAERKQASQQLAAEYQSLQLDQRLDRLDKAVAENEKRIRELTQVAGQQLAKHDHKALTNTLKQAENLQKHNSQLFKLIEGTEKKLEELAKRIASSGVKDA